MGNHIKSDLYKFSHTSVWLLHLVVPILGVLIFVGYYAISPMNEIDKVYVYIEVLSITFPVLIGIIAGMVTEMEQNAGSFQIMLTTQNVKYISHISKIIVLSIFGIMSSLIASVGFGICFSALGYKTLNLFFLTKIAIIMFISMIPLYLLSYLVSFLFGKGFSIGLGIVGGLLSALLLTGLGDAIWWYNPWGISARFSSSLLVAHFQEIKFIHFTDITNAFIFIIIFSVALMVLLILIFNKWEGRKSED